LRREIEVGRWIEIEGRSMVILVSMNKRYYSEYWLAVCPKNSPYIKADITAISTC
jgi:hypothetical protein